MSIRVPSPKQIAEQVDGVLQRSPEARLIGIRSPARRAWPEIIDRGGQRFRLLWSESGLDLRDRLAGLDGEEDRLVVLTSLSDEALGTDLLARFEKARLLQPNSWEMLRAAFQARDVDPRLGDEEWGSPSSCWSTRRLAAIRRCWEVCSMPIQLGDTCSRVQ